ncbi:MAG TPA: MFS transporter [Jatrophihabitantaceae bacterium]|nr:MFS transporter [Jatrophihabitantaceae bacterium]
MAALVGGGRAIIANRQLTRVVGTWGMWITGEWAFLVVLSVTAFDRGGTAAVAVVGVIRLIPGALAGPLVSFTVDRVSRVRVLVGVLLSWTVLVALAPAALSIGSLAGLYVIVGVASITSTLLRPAVSALIPQVVDRPEELAAANSTYSLLEAGGSLIGPLLAGALVSGAGTTARYLVVAAVFAIAALLAGGIRTDFKPSEHVRRAGWRRVVEPLLGFGSLLGPRRLRVVVAVIMAQAATRGALNVLVIVAAVRLLHSGLSSTGVLFAAVGAGGLIGAVLTMTLSGQRPALPFVVGMSMWGLPLILIAAHPTSLFAWFGLALIGIGNSVGDVSGLTLMHRLIPDHLLGRSFGAFWALAAAASAVGSLVAPALVNAFGIRSAILVVGATMLTAALLSWFSVRHIDIDLAVDDHHIEVLRHCALLAPLTRIAVEQLARHARTVEIAAGSTVIREGQTGETFYVVDAGQLDASVAGALLRTLSDGDCFGEIAALNHTPRTATVTARAPSRLLALDGQDFVHAVTARGPAEQAARQMISDRTTHGAAHPT